MRVVEGKAHARFSTAKGKEFFFELFVDFGSQIRARSKANQTFLSQLTCGCYGYLPTEHAENGGHYSAFVGSGTVGHVGGEMYVRKVLTEINEMFE